MFLTIWATLFILLDTQDCTAEYVHYFQQEYNEYHKAKSCKDILKLESKCCLIQDCIYDSTTINFDSISDHDDNGPTPLQGQHDEQSQAVNAVDKTIDQKGSDAQAGYVKWSTNTHDTTDTNDMYDTNRQDTKTN